MIRFTACLFVFIALGSSVYAGWYSEVETDEMTDKETLLIISDNDNAAIVCRPDQTALILFIIPDGKRISKDVYKVQYRFDKETVDTLFFHSAGGSSIFLNMSWGTSDVKEENLIFIKKMMDKNNLLIRVPSLGTGFDIKVDLNGLTETFTPHLKRCGLEQLEG